MKTTAGRRYAAIAAGVIAAFGLVLYTVQSSRAQYSETTFISLIRPYLNREVEVGSAGRMEIVTLEEIGYDYVVFRDHNNIRIAVPQYGITSLTINEQPIIHLSY